MRKNWKNRKIKVMEINARKRVLVDTAWKHFFLLMLFSILLTEFSFAQLKRFPVKRIDVDAYAAKSKNGGSRTQQTEPLTLPFWDDFSKPYLNFYPDTGLWVGNLTTWVNDGMAIHPPTINVATFDGLDPEGLPYNPTEVLLSGFTDSLVSLPINLSDVGEDSVAVGERNSVYLSFFYQWKGNGEAPDETDYLQLQFKDVGGDWQDILSIQPDGTFEPDVFYVEIIQVEGVSFFHDAFQFRFRSFGRQSGPYDTWNLDYVYLNKGRTPTDLSFPDRAISTRPGPLFGEFHAMPRSHLVSNDQLTPPHFEIQNMKNADVSVNFRTDGFFSNTDFGEDTVTTIYETNLAKATPINITDNVLFANEHKEIRLDTLPDVSDPLQFPPDTDSTLVRLIIALQSKDNVPQNNFPPIEPDSTGDYTPKYAPIQFTSNDTVTVDYVLSNYYAYDDGVAEYAAGLIEPGNLLAYEFELSDNVEQDTLIAFEIYFPRYGITSNLLVDFYIYED